MRRGDHHYPPSPPGHYVTPSERRHEYARRERPMVYQVYSNMNTFPGYSPVRTSKPPSNNISPPADDDDSLYASFSPPRPQNTSRQGRGSASSSIFRPKASPSVIVARDSSSSKTSPESHGGVRSKEITVSRSSVSAFPAKLHSILSSPEFKEYITWLPHGRAWRVLKPKVFEEKVVPKFFRSSKYASFMRQVNGWGFRRITTPGPDFNGYWHELFLRGLPDLCDRMKRPQKTDPEQKHEDPPDFYRVSKYSPLPEPERGPEVGRSSSMSSTTSCAPKGHRHGKESPDETGSGEHGIPAGSDSWDRSDPTSENKGKVAIDLDNVYDGEASRGPNKLSEADLHYLVQQNRALLKQAQLQQSRSSSQSAAPAGGPR